LDLDGTAATYFRPTANAIVGPLASPVAAQRRAFARRKPLWPETERRLSDFSGTFPPPRPPRRGVLSVGGGPI